MKNRFYELHTHSEYSIFDGMGKIKNKVKRAKELGYNSLGISDHGNICGLVEHYNFCKEANIKPILGVEAYFQPQFDKEQNYNHLCLFAMNMTGYNNICKMLSIANEEYFHKKPRITYDLLEKYNEGVIASTACIGGYHQQLILDNKDGKALRELDKFKEIFGDRLYIEIMPFMIDENSTQEYVNRTMYDFANKLDIKCIITTDSHFVYKEDIETHKMMFEMGGRDMGDTYVGRYMQHEKEVIKAMNEMHYEMNVDKMLDNLQEISDRCNVELKFEDTMPKIDWGIPALDKLKQLLNEGMKSRGYKSKDYFDRIRYEVDVIDSLGYTDYFLVIYDLINWCRENDIPTGVRGSAGNSLTNHLLGLSEVDPVKLNNIFERFLRFEKHKMVD